MTDTVRVPREPTEAMIEAANNAAMAFAGSDLSDADMTRLVWSAMLAASPQGEGDWITHDGGPNPVPCGGCGEANPANRCVGCLHIFGITEGVKP